MRDKSLIFLFGFMIGIVIAFQGGKILYGVATGFDSADFRIGMHTKNKPTSGRYLQVEEDFSKPMMAKAPESFGKYKQLTFELHRAGTFLIDGKSGYAWQKSESYLDSAFIRSTHELPKTYKISVTVGDIGYDLENIRGLANDPNYPEGPKNENGCYLLAITDEMPAGHHTNIWWHQHRKVVIDVDNNVWGHGMPHPIFMVYFDRDNQLVSFDGDNDQWQPEWKNAVTYESNQWYSVEVEKTHDEFILRVYDRNGRLLKSASADLKNIWHEDGSHPDYFVVGDPHENYYQGSVKIRSISMPVKIQ